MARQARPASSNTSTSTNAGVDDQALAFVPALERDVAGPGSQPGLGGTGSNGLRLGPLLTGAAAIGQLQRQVGNRAVGRWLGRNGPDATVQRFVGHEHESLGNVTGASIDLGNGVVLTWGQVVAIAGDEFGTVEDLKKAAQTPEGRRRIRTALEHDGVRGPIPASLEEQTDPKLKEKEQTQQTFAFLELAAENVTHFGEGGDARATWQSHHGRALHAAFEAGRSGSDAAFQQAQLLEAFGQHFLTDMFSGGHVRTPRREIMDFYAGKAQAMATAFEQNLRKRLEDALVSQVMLQIPPELRGNLAQRKAQERVHERVGQRLEEGIATIGGRDKLVHYFGRAIAGAVSGALHDRDGRQGVVVRSQAHPTPWLAKGDAKLGESPESRDQAELAILAAREELVAARHAGQQEPVIQKLIPSDPPSVLHFGFDSSTLDGPGAAAAAAAGAWLHTNPSDVVELVGHTDPLGTEGYNLALGERRANAVKAAVVAGGARPDQVTATSQGEAGLKTTNPRQYRENRRVELHWQCRATPPPSGPEPGPDQQADPARAQQARQALARFGPPYAAVERYVPEAVPDMNEPLPEWRWGQMPPEMVAELDTWIRGNLGPQAEKLIANVPETLPPETVDLKVTRVTLVLAPQQIVRGIVTQILQAPSRTLGDLIGEQPGRAAP